MRAMHDDVSMLQIKRLSYCNGASGRQDLIDLTKCLAPLGPIGFSLRSSRTDLGEQLKSRTKLRALYIPEQPDIAWEVVSSVGQMTDLIHLNLESCELTEEQCSVLCQQLQLIHHLERLDLSENPIGPKKKPNIWSNQSDPGDQMLRYSN